MTGPVLCYIIHIMRPKSTVLGITGPIGSGKDETCRILKKLGFYIIDADRIGHEVLRENTLKNKLISVFGREVLGPGGAISRKKLGGLVFSGRKRLSFLNSLTHPVIRKKIEVLVNRSRSSKVAINAAVLKEIGLSKYCDQIWLVGSSRPNRIKRLLRKGLNRKETLKRIKSQRSIESYKKESDIIIDNNGSKKDLAIKVKILISGYL